MRQLSKRLTLAASSVITILMTKSVRVHRNFAGMTGRLARVGVPSQTASGETAQDSDLWCREQLARNGVPMDSFSLNSPCSALTAHEVGEGARATADYGESFLEALKKSYRSRD
jgi:hypothetical protein